jgi:hypothetical protein
MVPNEKSPQSCPQRNVDSQHSAQALLQTEDTLEIEIITAYSSLRGLTPGCLVIEK